MALYAEAASFLREGEMGSYKGYVESILRCLPQEYDLVLVESVLGALLSSWHMLVKYSGYLSTGAEIEVQRIFSAVPEALKTHGLHPSFSLHSGYLRKA